MKIVLIRCMQTDDICSGKKVVTRFVDMDKKGADTIVKKLDGNTKISDYAH